MLQLNLAVEEKLACVHSSGEAKRIEIIHWRRDVPSIGYIDCSQGQVFQWTGTNTKHLQAVLCSLDTCRRAAQLWLVASLRCRKVLSRRKKGPSSHGGRGSHSKRSAKTCHTREQLVHPH